MPAGAALFMVWQIINAIFFGEFPILPVVVGGALIVTGGLIVSFWTQHSSNGRRP